MVTGEIVIAARPLNHAKTHRFARQLVQQKVASERRASVGWPVFVSTVSSIVATRTLPVFFFAIFANPHVFSYG